MFTWWCHTLGMTALAVFLLVRGLRGRWVGGEPRCRRCRYQLTGVESGRCPECGLEFDEFSVARGIRKRRWGSLSALVLIPLLWAPSQRLLFSLDRINWYHHYPTRVLIQRAQADERSAVVELERRALNDALPNAQVGRVTKLVLEKWKTWPSTPHRRSWVGLIDGLDYENRFSDAQKEQLFAPCAAATLNIRPVIRQGDYFVGELNYGSSQRRLRWYFFWHEPMEVRVGEQPIFSADGHGWRRRPPDGRSADKRVSLRIAAQPVGVHAVTLTGRHVFMHPKRSREVDDPSWSKIVRFDAQVEVLPADAPDPVKWVDDPALTDRLKGIVSLAADPFRRPRRKRDLRPKPDEWFTEASADGDSEKLRFMVQVREPSPVNLALEVVVLAGNAELPSESTASAFQSIHPAESGPVIRTGEASGIIVTTSVPRFEEEEIHIILRSSRDVARQTADLYKIWKGELKFGPYRINRGGT